ncbi:MAG: hypothetical protein MK212_17615, partial [Saprospiraceae bacterium]|nr:hypothetical protein [Saprospiraceae bacterium]
PPSTDRYAWWCEGTVFELIKDLLLNFVWGVKGILSVNIFYTFEYLESFIQEKRIPEELAEVLGIIPNNIAEVGKQELRRLEEVKKYRLDNWIGRV